MKLRTDGDHYVVAVRKGRWLWHADITGRGFAKFEFPIALHGLSRESALGRAQRRIRRWERKTPVERVTLCSSSGVCHSPTATPMTDRS